MDKKPKRESSVLGVLRAARVYLDDKDHWRARGLAANKRNITVDVDNPTAVRFCVIGACHRFATSSRRGRLAADYLNEEFPGNDVGRLWKVNDGPRGHWRILKGLDRAIKKLETGTK